MRKTIVRIGVTGAGALLALGLLAGPSAGAAPDKPSKGEHSNKVTCFEPEGKTQGRSLSDPDGTSNGGTDKPGCTRVEPWSADTDNDGNNGCGNDADREDDNNGNCGHKAEGAGNGEPGSNGDGEQDEDAKVKDEEVADDVQVQSAGALAADNAPANTTTAGTEVLGSSAAAPAAGETTTSTTAPVTEVLGETLSAPDTLARTGAGIGGLALLGGLLVGGGRLTVLARKLLRIG